MKKLNDSKRKKWKTSIISIIIVLSFSNVVCSLLPIWGCCSAYNKIFQICVVVISFVVAILGIIDSRINYKDIDCGTF